MKSIIEIAISLLASSMVFGVDGAHAVYALPKDERIEVGAGAFHGGALQLRVTSAEAKIGGAFCDLETYALTRSKDAVLGIRARVTLTEEHARFSFLPFGKYQLIISQRGAPIYRALVNHVVDGDSHELHVPVSRKLSLVAVYDRTVQNRPIVQLGSLRKVVGVDGSVELPAFVTDDDPIEIYQEKPSPDRALTDLRPINLMVSCWKQQDVGVGLPLRLPPVSGGCKISGTVASVAPGIRVSDIYPAIHVIAVSEDGRTEHRARCDEAGRYELYELIPGEYRLRAGLRLGETMQSESVSVSCTASAPSICNLSLRVP